MNDWRKPCKHGEYERVCSVAHGCPGGSPVTAADLESLGLFIPRDEDGNWPLALLDEIREHADTNPWIVQSAIEGFLDGLIPIPDPIPAE